MKIERLAAIAEIISSVAIVVTLVYLSVQTGQNTDALLAVSRQATLQGDLDIIQIGMMYPEFAQADNIEFTPEFETRYRLFLTAAMRTREFAWFQYQSGILDEGTWQSYMSPMQFMFSTQRAQAYLELYSGDPDFKSYLKDWLNRGLSGSQ